MDDAQKPAIAITMGDPCGIGPEVVVKALTDPWVYASCRPLVIGNTFAMERAQELNGARHAGEPAGRPGNRRPGPCGGGRA